MHLYFDGSGPWIDITEQLEREEISSPSLSFYPRFSPFRIGSPDVNSRMMDLSPVFDYRLWRRCSLGGDARCLKIASVFYSPAISLMADLFVWRCSTIVGAVCLLEVSYFGFDREIKFTEIQQGRR